MVFVKISTEIVGLIDEIKHDRIHGASELATQAVRVLNTAAERSQADSVEPFLVEQKEIGQRLMSARPAMAPLFNIINQFLSAVSEQAGGVSLESIRHFTVAQADEAIKNSLQAVAQIAKCGGLIAIGDRIMTNSYSSTVMAALKTAFTKHRNIEVLTIRSGAGRTGEGIA